MWELWLEHGVGNFDNFAQFKRAMRGEEEPRKDDEGTIDNEPEPPKDSYNEALALFGFNENEKFTEAELKKRYRVKRSRAHPDKGCEDPELFHQINEAYDLIFKRRNWT